MTSLDEVLSEWEHQWDGSPIDREAFQCVLRKIGHGDFSHVVFDDRRTKKGDKVADSQSTSSLGLRLRNSKSVDVGRSATLHISSPQNEESLDEEERKEQQRLITEAMEQTNDMARMAFARSVLFLEWWLDRPKSQEKLAPPQPRDNARGRYGKLRGHNSAEDSFDRSSVLEYCGLMMTAVRLSEIQKYLRSEADSILTADQGLVSQQSKIEGVKGDQFEGDNEFESVDDRLVHIQNLCWRAIGWEPDSALKQLQCLFDDECNESSDVKMLTKDDMMVETLTKYASAMTVAVTNATMSRFGNSDDKNTFFFKHDQSPFSQFPIITDDGTTRIINVSYSEKIVTLPQSTITGDDGNTNPTVHSLAAPTSNSMHEHTLSHQRRQMDIAHKTSMLQQQLWNEFQSLPREDQTKSLEKARKAQEEFLEEVKKTPPGPERVVLMQSMDREVQKLLVIYKLWCSHGANGNMVG